MRRTVERRTSVEGRARECTWRRRAAMPGWSRPARRPTRGVVDRSEDRICGPIDRDWQIARALLPRRGLPAFIRFGPIWMKAAGPMKAGVRARARARSAGSVRTLALACDRAAVSPRRVALRAAFGSRLRARRFAPRPARRFDGAVLADGGAVIAAMIADPRRPDRPALRRRGRRVEVGRRRKFSSPTQDHGIGDERCAEATRHVRKPAVTMPGSLLSRARGRQCPPAPRISPPRSTSPP